MRSIGKPRLGVWLSFLIALSVVPATAFAAQSEAADDCQLSKQICRSDGVVILATNADRRLLKWNDADVNLEPVSIDKVGPGFLEGLGAGKTVTLLVDGGDLNGAKVATLGEDIHALGGSVVLTDATLADANQLHGLVGLHEIVIGENGGGWSTGGPVDLYGVRSVIGDDGRRHTSYFTLLMDHPGNSKRVGKLDETTAGTFVELIGSNPPVLEFAMNPPLDGTECADDPQSCINKLAGATHVHETNAMNGDVIEMNNFIYGARSFSNNEDYYYVSSEVEISVCDFSPFLGVVYPAEVVASYTPWSDSILDQKVDSLFQMSPDSSEKTTTYSSSVDFGIGGQAGYSSQGEDNSEPSFDVAPNLSFSNSVMTSFPPIDITNESDLVHGIPKWEFANSTDTNLYNRTTVFDMSWIWAVNFGDYAEGAPFYFSSTPTLYTLCNPGNIGGLPINVTNNVPQPFDSFTLEAPVVDSVSPESVQAGRNFTIVGKNFYPSLVEAVLVGGQELESFDVDTDSGNTEITATAPSDPPDFNTPLAVVVRSSVGVSNDTVNITIEPQSP